MFEVCSGSELTKLRMSSRIDSDMALPSRVVALFAD